LTGEWKEDGEGKEAFTLHEKDSCYTRGSRGEPERKEGAQIEGASTSIIKQEKACFVGRGL